jgi:hypothetical protein
MEVWALIMLLSRGTTTVPVRVPMQGYEHCTAAGAEAERIAATMNGVKLTWTCQLEQ